MERIVVLCLALLFMGCAEIQNLADLEFGDDADKVEEDQPVTPQPQETAKPDVQNGVGGAGAAIDTMLTSPFFLFQADSVSKEVNFDGGATKRNGIAHIYSIGVYSDPNDEDKLKLFVNDRDNHRVLIYNSIPKDANALPDVVVGQADFVSGDANAGNAGASDEGFDQNVSVSVCTNGAMFVSDRKNNRVLGYNTIPKTNGVKADIVLGQANFTADASGTSANQFNQPYAVHCMEDKLFVVDKVNSRVVVFDPIPTTSNPSASFVIGQPDLDTGTGGCAANKLNIPYEAVVHNGSLYVADGGNHRVVKFSSVPSATGASATAVLGQQDLTSCQHNRTATTTPSNKSLYWPNSLAIKDNILAVSDHSNKRVMFFNLPGANDDAAFAQYGQVDFNTADLADPPTSSSLGFTKGIVFDGDYMWVSDGANKRLGIYRLPF